MPIICDTHVHVYPCYDIAALIGHLTSGLAAIGPGQTMAALLTEGARYDVFSEWLQDASPLAEHGFHLQPGPDEAHVTLRRDGEEPLHLFAGRQVVTTERVQILSLLSREQVPDGMSAVDTVTRILETKGVPVVSWAPGKWFPPRSRVVKELLHRYSPRELLLGDSSLRATVWPTPRLMAAGRRNGFSVLAGSDPLPFAGDEQYAGCYATQLDGELDAAAPVSSLRHLLMRGAAATCVGRRMSATEMLRRLGKNARS